MEEKDSRMRSTMCAKSAQKDTEQFSFNVDPAHVSVLFYCNGRSDCWHAKEKDCNPIYNENSNRKTANNFTKKTCCRVGAGNEQISNSISTTMLCSTRQVLVCVICSQSAYEYLFFF